MMKATLSNVPFGVNGQRKGSASFLKIMLLEMNSHAG